MVSESMIPRADDRRPTTDDEIFANDQRRTTSD
jgi:hypothetical protein